MATTNFRAQTAITSPQTWTALYTVPATLQATLSTVHVCNRGSDAGTFRIRIAYLGAAEADAQMLYYDTPLSGNNGLPLTIGITLRATDVVYVAADRTTFSFNAFGVTW